MGMYTELNFNSELKKDTPENIITILKCMIDGSFYEDELPDHNFFKTNRWDWMLQSDSYYFDAKTESKLVKEEGKIYLRIQCNLKNYDREIEEFLDWIMPYCDKEVGDYLGHSRYEESEEPTLIYKEKDKTYTKKDLKPKLEWIGQEVKFRDTGEIRTITDLSKVADYDWEITCDCNYVFKLENFSFVCEWVKYE